MTDHGNGDTKRKLIGLLLGPLMCLLIISLPQPAGLSPAGMRAIDGAVWMIVWWMFEPFHLSITSLWAVIIFPLLGVVKPAAAFAQLGSSTIMLFLGATIILGAWHESGLIQRYAYWALNLPVVKGKPARLAAVFGITCGVMTMVVPNIPCAILFVAIAVAISKAAGLKPGESNLSRRMVIMSGVGSSVGGCGTPIGGAPNLIVIGMVAATLKYNMEFWQWTAIGFPLALGMIILMLVFARVFFPLKPEEQDLPVAADFLVEKLRSLGPVSRYEKVAMTAMLAALLLWIFAKPVTDSIPALAPLGKLLTTPYIAILVGCLLFAIPLKTKGPIYAMNWDQGLKAINWSIIMFLMGAFIFGDAMTSTGVDKWLAGVIRGILGDISGIWVLLFLIVVGGLISQVITNLAVIALLVPITAKLAVLYGLNPVVACLTVGILSNNGIMFPFSSAAVAASMMGSEGFAKPRDYIMYGLAVVLGGALIAFILALTLGPLVFGDVKV